MTHQGRGLIFWWVFFALIWLLLSSAQGWLLGLLTVTGAALLCVRLGLEPVRLRWRYLPAFSLFFLRTLLHGGWDVALRALNPRLPIAPAWHDYQFSARSQRVRLVFSAMVGLLPGTLSTGPDNDAMRVHVLDERQNWLTTAQALESHLMQLLGDADA